MRVATRLQNADQQETSGPSQRKGERRKEEEKKTERNMGRVNDKCIMKVSVQDRVRKRDSVRDTEIR